MLDDAIEASEARRRLRGQQEELDEWDPAEYERPDKSSQQADAASQSEDSTNVLDAFNHERERMRLTHHQDKSLHAAREGASQRVLQKASKSYKT